MTGTELTLADLTLPDVSLADLSLADLIADAAMVRLPTPRSAAAPRVIDLRIPVQRPLEIPAATINLVEGYADSHL